MFRTGYESYQHSFQEFFETVISPLTYDSGADNLPIIRAVVEIFKRPPFNAGFGMYLYLARNEVRHIFPVAEQILKSRGGSGGDGGLLRRIGRKARTLAGF